MVPVRMWGGGVLGFGVSGSGLPALAYTLAESSSLEMLLFQEL